MKIIFEVGDRVKLPLDETGTLVEILPYPWGFTHIVRLRKANAAFEHKTNQRLSYKPEQLKPDYEIK
jgi:hypothetical protein